jgi:hypothetical protein
VKNNRDLTDRIRDFLKGRLSEAEAKSFRAQMDHDPELEDKVAFASLMMSGLEEIARRRNAVRKRWVIGIIAAVLLAMALFFLWKNRRPVTNPEEKILRTRVKEDGNSLKAIGQGGSHSPERESDRVSGIVFNSQGGVVIGGVFNGQPVFGDIVLDGFGKTDIYLAAANQRASFQWARQFGSGEGNDYLQAITVDNRDNIIATGGFFDNAVFGDKRFSAIGTADEGEGDFFVAKFDPVGNLLWLDHFGGDRISNLQTGINLGHAVTTDHLDNIIAAGKYVGSPRVGNTTLPAGGPNEEVFLAKYSPGGQLLWIKTITGKYSKTAGGVTTDAQGNIFFTGFFGHHNLHGNANFDGVELDTYGGIDIFLAKYFPDGRLDWVRQAGSAKDHDGRDYGSDVAAGADGSCVLTGMFIGNARFESTTLDSLGGRDAFLAKYSSNGNLLWVTSFGGHRDDEGQTVCLDDEGNIYCTGNFTDSLHIGGNVYPSQGQEDIFIVKYSPEGDLIWVRQFGGDRDEWNSDCSGGLAINKDGQLVATGIFSGTMQIGGQTLTSAGREDIFILFFDQDGNLVEAKQMVYQL